MKGNDCLRNKQRFDNRVLRPLTATLRTIAPKLHYIKEVTHHELVMLFLVLQILHTKRYKIKDNKKEKVFRRKTLISLSFFRTLLMSCLSSTSTSVDCWNKYIRCMPNKARLFSLSIFKNLFVFFPCQFSSGPTKPVLCVLLTQQQE